MRIGIYRSYSPIVGGGYHYEIVVLNALSEMAKRSAEEFVCVNHPGNDLDGLATEGGLYYRGIPIHSLPLLQTPTAPPEAFLNTPPKAGPELDINTIYADRNAARIVRDAGIDLVIQLNPNAMAFSTLMPFVIPIHDLNHRIQPEFPEVSAFGETNLRDYIYTNICKYATFVMVDSEVGKSDVLKFYGNHIDADRIRVLPYYPPFQHGGMPGTHDLQRVAEKYCLPPRFLFYPAQFWRHKNHELIIRALRLIADENGPEIPIVLCGSYADYYRALNFKKIMALADELRVRDRVHYLGRVPDKDIPALYRLSTGLVMPTFFGPTNIPPLEAWSFGRPVIASDIPGMRAQIGDAGLLVDPRSPQDLAGAMLRLWRDEPLGVELAERGQRRLSGYSWDSFVDGVAAIVNEACLRVREGHTPRYPNITL